MPGWGGAASRAAARAGGVGRRARGARKRLGARRPRGAGMAAGAAGAPDKVVHLIRHAETEMNNFLFYNKWDDPVRPTRRPPRR